MVESGGRRAHQAGAWGCRLGADRSGAASATVGQGYAAALRATQGVATETVGGVARRADLKSPDGAPVVLAHARGWPDSTGDSTTAKYRRDRIGLGETHAATARCCAKDAIVVGDARTLARVGAGIRARRSVTTAVNAGALVSHYHAGTAGIARVAVGHAVDAAHRVVFEGARTYPRATGASIATSAGGARAAVARRTRGRASRAGSGHTARVSGGAHRPATDGEQNGQYPGERQAAQLHVFSVVQALISALKFSRPRRLRFADQKTPHAMLGFTHTPLPSRHCIKFGSVHIVSPVH